MVNARQGLLDIRTMLSNKAEQDVPEPVQKSHARLLKTIALELAKLEAAIAALVKATPHFAKRAEIIESVPGLAATTAAGLIAAMPELGEVSNEAIAALLGVAPYDDDSGKRQGQRQIKQYVTERVAGRGRRFGQGTVKNIADFGAFVDLGGIDGLLHITDMSWGRINHPGDMLKIDDQVEVMVLHVDKDREKIALGLKQKSASPWENVEKKYPVGTRVTGEVVNVMSYGAFVKLEEGIEGLVHISEMSWTKRINHPSELVNIGDKIEVVVLGINRDKQEISLGMKQTQVNPWDQVAGKYPTGTMVDGTVRNLTNYGAFIEIEEGIDGLLHISDMSWTRKIGHPNEILEKGQKISCQVLNVDQDRKRIALGLKQLKDDPWETDIPGRYEPNDVVKGKVTKLTNFGVFVELEPGLEGLLHISELADHKVDSPEEVVKVGDEIEVKILRVDRGERKIGLRARKPIGPSPTANARKVPQPGDPAAEAAKETKELKGGLGGGGPLFSMGGPTPAAEEEATPKKSPRRNRRDPLHRVNPIFREPAPWPFAEATAFLLQPLHKPVDSATNPSPSQPLHPARSCGTAHFPVSAKPQFACFLLKSPNIVLDFRNHLKLSNMLVRYIVV